MLTDLAVEGYQSLKDVKLKLGMFTVVVGPTGSGKSALIRAAQLCAFNARGTSYIRKGSSQAIVALADEAAEWAVTITRGGRGNDAYRVAVAQPVPAQDAPKFPMVRTYTKLAGKVPDEVTSLLGLTPLNFAGQFDRPYLLADSAGEVARALGQLTKVTLIFDAAREASRRKTGLAADLRSTEAELQRIRDQLPRFMGLPARIQALRRAEEAITILAATQHRKERLQALLSQHSTAQAQLEAAQAALPVVPDLEPLASRVSVVTRLRGLIDAYENWVHDIDENSSYIEAMQAQALESAAKAATLLREAGRCPTCGADTKALGGHGDHSGGSISPAGRVASMVSAAKEAEDD